MIGFNNYIEVRNFIGKGQSLYAKDFDHLILAIRKMQEENGKDVNLYFGINSRAVKSNKSFDVMDLKVFFFDIEWHTNPKPKFCDYEAQLFQTKDYLVEKINLKYGIKPSALVFSGRGLHLYYRFKPLPLTSYMQLKIFCNNILKETEEKKPIKEIKYDDKMFDPARVAGIPATINTKYEEKPLRKILEFNMNNVFDLAPLIEDIKPIEKNKKSRKTLMVPSDLFYSFEEFQLLRDFEDLPEGTLHNKIIFALKLRCKLHGLKCFSEFEKTLSDLGYNEVADWEYQDKDYSPRIFIDWVCKHYDWAVANKYFLSQNMLNKIFFYHDSFLKIEGRAWSTSDKDVSFADSSIVTFKDLIEYIKSFHKQNSYKDLRGYYILYTKSLEEHVKKNIDAGLWDFINMNKMGDGNTLWYYLRFLKRYQR